MARFMLRVIFASIALVCSLYKVSAEASSDSVNIVIAMDQSGSMFDNNPSHNEITRDGLLVFLSEYELKTCVEVSMTYFGWGVLQTKPVVTAFKAAGAGGHFAVDITTVNFVNLSSTITSAGITSAIALVGERQATENIIILITDGIPDNSGATHIYSPQLVPSEIRFAAITLGNSSVKKFIRDNVLRPDDQSFHVGNAREFERAFGTILDSLPVLNTPCIG
jgi:hypothetical protein